MPPEISPCAAYKNMIGLVIGLIHFPEAKD
jgi:hypothetical protein